MPGVEAEFALVINNQNRPTSDFTTCAAGGGHSDQRCGSISNQQRTAFDGRVGGEWTFVRRGNRHAFGAVDRRAAAHCDQAIAVVGFVACRSGTHSCFSWIRRCLVKHRHGHARQIVQGFLQNACSLDPLVCDDQWTADAHALTFLLEQFDGASFKLNVRHIINKGHDLSF